MIGGWQWQSSQMWCISCLRTVVIYPNRWVNIPSNEGIQGVGGWGCGDDGGDGGGGLVVPRSRKSTYSSGISSISMVKSWLDPHGILLDPHKMVETSSYLIWLRFLFGSTKKMRPRIDSIWFNHPSICLLFVNITGLFLVRTSKLSISMVRILKKLPRKKLPMMGYPIGQQDPSQTLCSYNPWDDLKKNVTVLIFLNHKSGRHFFF